MRVDLRDVRTSLCQPIQQVPMIYAGRGIEGYGVGGLG